MVSGWAEKPGGWAKRPGGWAQPNRALPWLPEMEKSEVFKVQVKSPYFPSQLKWSQVKSPHLPNQVIFWLDLPIYAGYTTSWKIKMI